MDTALKQRLVGAVVLTCLAVIFLPSLFNGGRPEHLQTLQKIPPMPLVEPVPASSPDSETGLQPGQKPLSGYYAFDPEQASTSAQVEKSDGLQVGLDEKGLVNAWVVQVGSFSSKEKALDLLESLKKDGHTAFAREVNKAGGMIVRVMIGPKLNRQNALEIKKKVDRKYGLQTLVMKAEP
jgi:DedD protein